MDQDDTEKIPVISPTPPELRPCLLVLTGISAGRLYRLAQGRSMLGRAEDAAIVLQDRGISRNHAVFRVNGESVELEDLESTNGTFIGSEKVTTLSLLGGERIQFGATVQAKFDFQGPGEEQLLEGVTRDYLTGALNRAYFDQRLKEACAASRRSGVRFACAYIDLDRFKQLNDTHGHAAGDQVLQELVRRVQELKRENDTFARYGGEEFVLLLPGTDEEGARVLCERLRTRIASQPFELTTTEGNETVEVTVSLGLWTGDGDQSPRQILQQADQALYRAKSEGRNRVCLVPSGLTDPS